jgi:hypothetical protein
MTAPDTVLDGAEVVAEDETAKKAVRSTKSSQCEVMVK